MARRSRPNVEFDPRESALSAFRLSRLAAIIVAPDPPRWTILDVNEAYLAVTRHTREGLVGVPLFDAFPESVETTQEHGSHRIAASLVEAMRGQRVVLPVQRYDLPVAGTAGTFEEQYWQLSTRPLHNDAGEIIALLHEVENVTARERGERETRRLTIELEARTEEAERARRAAEAAERQLQTVFAQSPASVGVTVGRDHRFVLVNRGYERLVGRPVRVGQTFREALPEIAAQGYEALLDQVFTTGEPYVAHEAYARLDKGGPAPEEGWYDFVYQPLVDGEGKVTGVLQQGVEVTAHVRAREAAEFANQQSQDQAIELEAQAEELQATAAQLEERTEDAERAAAALADTERQFHTLVDAIPTLAWTARPDGFIDWYNARWYEYTGTTPDDMAGWGWRTVHDPVALPAVLERWQESLATGQPFDMTFPLRGADGRYRQFLTRVSPITDGAGRVVRWFGTNTDVEAERTARAAAEEANQAKTNFLATMSHELRTPLNAIAGYSELLDLGIHGPVTDEQREALSRIQRSQRHLLGLINDVLNFAKLEAGHVEYRVQEVSVREVVDALEPLIAPQLQAKSMRFDRGVWAGDVVVAADREKLQQVLLNLLSNAIKFTTDGGTITLHCELRDGILRLGVQDTGVGIPADRLEDVFAPFVQIDRRLNAPHEGTGLGLAISRDLARGMGGDLTVESTVGVGSTFTLTLPVSR